MMTDLSGKKILVMGMGSAGRRHARIAEDLGAYVAALSRRTGMGDYHDVATALSSDRWDAVVIATETASHAQLLRQVLAANFKGKILIEKPFLRDASEITPFENTDISHINIAYNLRFHPVIRHVKDWLSKRHGNVIGATFYVGQHLDDWRPNRFAKETYSALKSGGGGVLRDLSHELDLANWLLGAPLHVTALGGRMGEITVDSDDFWNILAVHEGCPNVSIHLNYLDQPAKRQLKLWTGDDSLEVDFLTGRIQEGPDYVTLPMDASFTYQQQLLALFRDGNDVCSKADGLMVMQYIAAIEAAACGEGEMPSWVAVGDPS